MAFLKFFSKTSLFNKFFLSKHRVLVRLQALSSPPLPVVPDRSIFKHLSLGILSGGSRKNKSAGYDYPIYSSSSGVLTPGFSVTSFL
jgi:hypothetical protein